LPLGHLCPEPGCGVLHYEETERCAPHAAAKATRDNRRRHGKQRAQGRDQARWRHLRKARLEHDGYRCQLRLAGCRSRATTVHLDPALGGHHDLATIDDVVSACGRCHGHADGGRATPQP
jgi:hypothetical protein